MEIVSHTIQSLKERIFHFALKFCVLPVSISTSNPELIYSLFLNIFYLFIFRERGREGERKGEKHQYVLASHMPPTGDLALNPGMCPNWESNQELFGL